MRIQFSESLRKSRRRSPIPVLGSLLSIVILVILVERSQSVPKHEAADVLSLLDPVLDGGAEVNARVDAGLAVLGGRLGKARKRPRQAGKRNTARNRKRHVVVTGRTDATPPKRHRRGCCGSRCSRESSACSATSTTRIGDRRIVSVRVAGADRGHRPPEIEVVLRLESCDEPIGHREVDEREQTRRVPGVETLRLAQPRVRFGSTRPASLRTRSGRWRSARPSGSGCSSRRWPSPRCSHARSASLTGEAVRPARIGRFAAARME